MTNEPDMDLERDFGPQPIGALLEKHGLRAHDLVAASTAQLTHKMVARAVKGRRLTPNTLGKVLAALNAASGGAYAPEDAFTYAERPNARGNAAGRIDKNGSGTNGSGTRDETAG